MDFSVLKTAGIYLKTSAVCGEVKRHDYHLQCSSEEETPRHSDCGRDAERNAPPGLGLLMNSQRSASSSSSSSSSDAAPPVLAAVSAHAQLLQDAGIRGRRGENGPRQFGLRPMHPLFPSLRVRLHRRGASVREHGGLRGEMPAVHARDVAEREHHGVEAALHRGGVGTRVLL